MRDQRAVPGLKIETWGILVFCSVRFPGIWAPDTSGALTLEQMQKNRQQMRLGVYYLVAGWQDGNSGSNQIRPRREIADREYRGGAKNASCLGSKS
jgi:hypothetical protein